MKLTEQERIELKFITRVLWKLFAGALIVISLAFGWMLSSFYFEQLEVLIATDFMLFLMGMFILIWKKDKKGKS